VAARRGSSSTGEGKCNGHGNGESHRERNGRAITSAALDGLGSGKVGGAGGAHAASARAGGSSFAGAGTSELPSAELQVCALAYAIAY